MNAPTPPTKRRKLSYCDIDFLIKLHKAKVPRHTPRDNDDRSDPEPDFLTLLSYGADVNINLNWRFPPPNSASTSASTLTASAGDVNCDSKDLNKTPLFENDHVQVKMKHDALVRLLTSEGLGINCPQLAGDLNPLVLEEARRRFAILKALLTSGTDTNRVRPGPAAGSGCDEANCEFCWNLQFLRNFEQFQQLDNNRAGQCQDLRRLVLNSLLASGSEVNSIRCRSGCLGPGQGYQGCKNNSQSITDLLVTYGHKVNSVLCD